MLNAKDKELSFLVKKEVGRLKRTFFKPKPLCERWFILLLLPLSKSMRFVLLLHCLHGLLIETSNIFRFYLQITESQNNLN